MGDWWFVRLMRRPHWGVAASIAVLVVAIGGYAAFIHFRFERDGRQGLVVAVAAAPVVALVCATASINLLYGYLAWVHERIWQPWQGRYYAFDDHRVRIVEARGGLWFSSADVHAALGMRARAGVLRPFGAAERRQVDEIGDALSNAGLVRLLARSTDARVQRFLHWAERDVRRPWQKKRDR